MSLERLSGDFPGGMMVGEMGDFSLTKAYGAMLRLPSDFVTSIHYIYCRSIS
jgi:hypothetical protein